MFKTIYMEGYDKRKIKNKQRIFKFNTPCFKLFEQYIALFKKLNLKPYPLRKLILYGRRLIFSCIKFYKGLDQILRGIYRNSLESKSDAKKRKKCIAPNLKKFLYLKIIKSHYREQQ